MLHTPLRDVLALDWDECLLWWREADRIHAETYGLMAGRGALPTTTR